MSGLDELQITFFEECEDLLDRLGNGLRDLARDPAKEDMETVHAVFRAVHSIKGGAAAFGFDDLVQFAHRFETALDGLRSGRLTASTRIMDTLLRAGDVLADLVAGARDGGLVPRDRTEKVLGELEEMADPAAEDDAGFVFEPVMLALDPIPAGAGLMDAGMVDAGMVDAGMVDPGPADPPSEPAGHRYLISIAPKAALYRTGNEPAALIVALGALGDTTVRADFSSLPRLCDLDLSQPHLRWQVCLVSQASPAEIEQVFEFIGDTAEITMTADDSLRDGPPRDGPPGDGVPDGGPLSDAPPHDGPSSGPAPLGAAPARAALPPPPALPGPPPGPVGTTPGAEGETVVHLTAPATIRVNLSRVDRLINLIGELVIMEAVLAQAITSAGLDSSSNAAAGLDRIRKLAGEIQDGVMAIRAQPLKPVFQRMERILREATEATGKKAVLVSIGENTEVDKTVIERLVDPLTHMIRNSVDHGLEDAARRAAAGKPSEGTITLSAAHRSGRVIIEVSDDGAGIDRVRVRDVAERKGLIPPNAVLAASEIDNLLFLPGFSSKAEVSEISGRGVGLDVVRREIQALGGRVSITSVEGAGSTFTIALPLTLAVLEGMLLQFGEQTMVLPLSAIVETLSPASATVHTVGSTGRVVANRGELIPVIDLASVFGTPEARPAEAQGVFIVVETDGGMRAALAVDHILDQRQVVIKSLEDNYGPVPGISAATILGDGRIALIIDPEEVVHTARPDLPAASLNMRE